MSTPYCIPERRELTAEERALLHKLVEQTGEQRVDLSRQIDRLKVVARCGCGECPGVLFGFDLNEQPNTNAGAPVASLRGVNADGVDVGAYLHAPGGRISELAATAWSGGDAKRWPSLVAMKATGEHLPSNSASLTDAFSSLRCACGAAKRER
jgi:hypothetical protein